VYSLDDNLLLDHDGVRVHYRAPTEPGSSGSPVLDRQWELIALHHAGRPSMPKLHGSNETYAANEGIAIAAIRAAIVEAASKP
jgi:V8-like Glu-specific endopeptidase